MEGACSCYIAGQFNGGRMVMLQVTLMEGKMMLWRWPVERRENFHVIEVVTNGGRMVMLQKW